MIKTCMVFQSCLLRIHEVNTFAVVSFFYPYHQHLHYVQLASAHRQGLAADEFKYFLLYMLTVLTSISLNFILGRQSDQLSYSNSQDRLSCKNFPSCISQAFLLYYPLKPAVKTTIKRVNMQFVRCFKG